MMVSLRGSPVYPPVPSATTPGQLSYPLSRGSFIPGARWQGPSGYTPLIVPQGVVSVPGFAYSVSFRMIPCKLQLLVMYELTLYLVVILETRICCIQIILITWVSNLLVDPEGLVKLFLAMIL